MGRSDTTSALPCITGDCLRMMSRRTSPDNHHPLESPVSQRTLPVPTATRADAPVRHRRGLALAIIVTCQLMLILDATVMNVALPRIQTGLHFSSTGLAWVMNAYTLTFGGLLLLGGRAGDILGRRRTFMVGIALFTLASLAGGLATSAAWLIVARC